MLREYIYQFSIRVCSIFFSFLLGRIMKDKMKSVSVFGPEESGEDGNGCNLLATIVHINLESSIDGNIIGRSSCWDAALLETVYRLTEYVQYYGVPCIKGLRMYVLQLQKMDAYKRMYMLCVCWCASFCELFLPFAPLHSDGRSLSTGTILHPLLDRLMGGVLVSSFLLVDTI